MATRDEAVMLDVRGMTCASCVRRVERALGKVEGVETASVNFAAETARVTLAADVPVAALVAAVEKAGYGAAPAAERRDPAARNAELRRTLWTLLAGAVLGVPAIMLAMAMDIADLAINDDHRLTGWILLALTAPVQAGLGWRFYRGSWTSLRHLNPNMDVLVALGTSVAFGYSTWTVIAEQHERHMYFDVSAAVLLFITMGKYFEERSKGAASEAISSLLGLAARHATVVRDGLEIEVPVEALALGDRFIVRPGQRIPVDGRVHEGRAVVDESMVTGESIPIERGRGEAVIGGTIVQDGVVRAEVTAIGAQSAVQRLARLVEEAQGSKAPIQQLVDRVAAVFVPAVILLAVAVFLTWGLGGGQWTEAMVAAVAVLVVACPCALGLATPTAIMVGTGMGAERGILIRNADVLERIRDIDTVVLDKTGTLTEGRPQVIAIWTDDGWSREQVLQLAAGLESGSGHPLARAVVDAATEANLPIATVESFASETGLGVTGDLEGHALVAGSPALLGRRSIPLSAGVLTAIDRFEAAAQTAIVVASDGKVAGVIGIADALKQNAPRAVSALRGMGLRIILLTGDNERTARTVAAAARIDEVHAGALPADKLALVRALQAEGRRVAMVGDGINDAPALAQADVGVAMSTGTDVAIEAGGVTLLHGDVSRVAEAIQLGRATLTTIRQNLVWAFGYNVVALPIAALGLLNPILAGGAMAFSSVSVMGNSLRLRSKSRAITEASGNVYRGSHQGFVRANRAPLVAMASAALVLLVPLAVFTAVDRGWFTGGDAASGEVEVLLSNWEVTPSRDILRPGEVTLRAVHDDGHSHGGSEGGAMHNLVIARIESDGTRTVIGRTSDIPVGAAESITVDLDAGEYEIFCDVVESFGSNTVSHYQNGMHVRVMVRR